MSHYSSGLLRGGGGVLFALFVTPIIRAWDRLSIAINGVSLTIFAILLQAIFIKFFQSSFKKGCTFYLIVTTILIFGLWDQSGRIKYYNSEVTNQYNEDRAFYKELASDFPNDSPVYQLPYVPLPYSVQNLSYSQLLAYTYAPNLRWNIGGLTNSPSAKLSNLIALLPIDVQINALKAMGFKALIFYKNHTAEQWWEDKYTEIEAILGQPIKINNDGSIIVFSITTDSSSKTDNKISPWYYLKDYLFNLDFTKPLIIDNYGFSGTETWGTWAEGHESVLKFPIILPEKFRLEIQGHGFADNSIFPTKIIIGNKTYEVIFNGESIAIKVEDIGETDSIVFVPLKPTAPSDISDSTDARKLTIGLVSLKVIE